jgi:hypothetical protein
MRTVNINVVLPPRPVSTVVQMTSRRFEFRMGWGTVYVAKKVGRYWSLYFNGWRKDRWDTPFTKLSQLREWFKLRDEPYFNHYMTVEQLEKIEKSTHENFYEKHLLGDWDAKDYNTCSQCGAPVSPGHSGKCGQPCL